MYSIPVIRGQLNLSGINSSVARSDVQSLVSGEQNRELLYTGYHFTGEGILDEKRTSKSPNQIRREQKQRSAWRNDRASTQQNR